MSDKKAFNDTVSIMTDSDVSKKIDAVLHLNIFLPNDKENSYMEIGILVSRKEYNNFDRNFNIDIIFPFEISNYNFKDMKNELCDGKTLNMIFNEETYLNRDKLDFRLKEYKLGNIRLCNTTLNNDLSITMSVAEKQKNSYFRFRINNISNNISEEKLSDARVNPLAKTVQIIGFSINSTKRYTKEVNNALKFNEINAFVILDSTTELIEKSRPIKSFRVLEDKLWKQYIKCDINSTMMVYQFKDKAINEDSINGWRLFLKSMHHKKSIIDAVLFLTFLIVVALVSNFFSKMLFG